MKSESWKQDLIHEEMAKVISRTMEVWDTVEEGYGPEISYSIILNICFQFCVAYQKKSNHAVKACQVLEHLIKDLKEMQPPYITESSKSSVEDHTNE